MSTQPHYPDGGGMTLSKETRVELRRRCPTPEETDALLDLADEREKAEQDAHEQRLQFDRLFDEAVKIREQRDRYRALLEEVKTDAGMVGLIEPGTLNRIDAALEGK